MASYPVERGRFLERMRSEGCPEAVALGILRDASTLQRLAVAACNGEWPCDGGSDRWPTKPCAECEMHYAPASLSRAGVCPDCRTTARLRARVAALGDGWEVSTAGDPRGAVVKLRTPSDRGDSWGDPRWLCVPTRD